MRKPLLDLPSRDDKSADIAVAKRARKKTSAPATVKGGGGIATKIANIKAMVLKHLGQYEAETLCIRSEIELHDYITKAIEFGRIAIDTETTGLDPMLDECVGVCLYVKGEKTAYVPMNHISYITGEKCENQLSKEVVAKELERLNGAKTKVIMFNAPFDLRVLKNRVGVRLHCAWDCSVCSRMLNENEKYEMTGKVGLKQLHKKYCLNGKDDMIVREDTKVFSFDELFDPKHIKFNVIPINVAYLYAAHDPKITDELFEFQAQWVYYDRETTPEDRNGMNGVAWTFFNIEMPIVDCVVEMEDTGVCLNVAYARELSVKYHEKEEETLRKVYTLFAEYADKIQAYRDTHPNSKLSDPIKVGSPQQLAIFFYDILGCDVIDKKSPRGTGNKILKAMKLPIADAILEYRAITKLISTYIDKLPDMLNPNDNRLHCKFNQYGADTGRFSSSDPNLQNIPSHNKDIRPMFVASDGYVLLSSDYSQQEPSCLAAFCKEMGYTALFDARFKGNDLYSEVAGACFELPYEMCCEFDANHQKNPPEYKERRNMAKPVLLGILYGRGDPSVAEGMGISIDDAKKLKTNLYKKFPEIHEFEESSLQMARERGYVTTICGRKRRLPNLQLPEYEFTWEKGYEPDGDILDFDDLDVEVPVSKQRYYETKLHRVYRNKKQAVINEALKEHIVIIDNGAKIAAATRQCVNARIQGSAADLTKLAMIEIDADEVLKELGFRMLIPVHDEIIGECPKKNAKKCSARLAEIMSQAAQEILNMPFSCDVEVSEAWYGKEYVIEANEDEWWENE